MRAAERAEPRGGTGGSSSPELTEQAVAPWGELFHAGRHDATDRALARWHAVAGQDTAIYGPTGHAIVPATLAGTARRCWVGGNVLVRRADLETELTPAVLHGTGVTALRYDGELGADRDGQLPWLCALAWLRLGLSRRLLGADVAYLGRRTVGGTPLLHQQMVRGSLADVLIAHMEIEAVLCGPAVDAATIADMHAQITTADRRLSRLFGASGFTTGGGEGLGWLPYLSELLADAYLGRAGTVS
jgi:hypothetical protein